MKVYYLAGYGRSGSTLLGRLEGRRRGAVVLGEAYKLASGSFLEASVCSCGAAFPTCAHWAAVHDELIRFGAAKVSQSRRHWLEGPFGLFVPMSLLRKWVHTAAFSTRYRIRYSDGVRALARISGGCFVDTSKTTRVTANRARLLAAAGLDVHLLVATRRLPDVVRSHHNGRRRHGRATSRLGSWLVVPLSRAAAHLAARWSGMSLGRPIEWIPLDQSVAEAGRTCADAIRFDHLIAGNRMRRHRLDAMPAERA